MQTSNLSATYCLVAGPIMALMLVLPEAAQTKEVTVTIERTEHRPKIDGVLDDSTWVGVEAITGFMQYYPIEGAEPSERTEMYIAYDEDFFYLGFKCFDANMDDIRATMSLREDVDNDECIGFAFDTYNSERELFLFNVNPYGIVSDFIWHYDGYSDVGWDSDLKARGKLNPDSYCIEVAVPFKSLRMPARDEQEWGFYALRSIKHKDEFLVWPPRKHEIPNIASQASLLKGIRGVEAGRNIAFIPYLFSSYVGQEASDDLDGEMGLDTRYGITSSLMLDVTVNPDYSQIEADPDRIEITQRYLETLPEKRPFFTEGTDIFASNQRLFYSRSIANPVAGVKLTGKVGSNRIGFLSAVDDKPSPETPDYYNHLRIKREILRESTIGLTTTNRDDLEEGSYNRTVSADAVFRWMRAYSLKSQVTRTWTRESDTNAPYEATGYNINVERFGSGSYNSLWYSDFPPEFEAQSGQMLDVVGYREIGTQNDLSFRKAFGRINSIELHGGAKARFNHVWEREEEYFWTASEMSISKLWTKLRYFHNHEFVDGTDFRYSGFEYELWNSPKRFLEYYASAIWGGAAHYSQGITGWRYRLHASVTLKPVSRLVADMSISREDFYLEYVQDRLYLQTVTWNKLSYQIIPGMFVRGIYQYKHLEKISDTSLLFAYEYRPLSNVYVGANFNGFHKLCQIGNDIEVFTKVSYLWRL